MQSFIQTVKTKFGRKKKRFPEEGRKNEDITTDATMIPDVSECSETCTGEKPYVVNSPRDTLAVPANELPSSKPADCVPTAPPELLITAPQEEYQEWSVSDVISEFVELGKIPKGKQKEIVEKANNAVLSLPEHFYDFCMVSSEDDYHEAKVLKDEIGVEFSLRGCTIYEDDFFSLGEDIFMAYEGMMNRSTKIFFYITRSLNEDEFCKRLQSASVFQGLMSKVQREKEKCVPVFPNGICRVPLPLSGIGGLEIPNKSLTAHRLKITYKEEVRQQRMLQEQERRRKHFFRIVESEVKKCLQGEVSENDPRPLDSRYEDNCGCRGRNHTSTSPERTPSPSKYFDGVQELLQTATSAPVVTSSELNIDSNTAHIGHNITIHVHYNPTDNEVASDSSSTSSDN